MFLIQYWLLIIYTKALHQWRKLLKLKRLREEERKLKEILRSALLTKWQGDALKGDIKPDLILEPPGSHIPIDRQPQGNLESEEGH